MLPPTAPLLPLFDPPTVRAVYDIPRFVTASPLRQRLTAVVARARRTEKVTPCQCPGIVAGSSS